MMNKPGQNWYIECWILRLSCRNRFHVKYMVKMHIILTPEQQLTILPSFIHAYPSMNHLMVNFSSKNIFTKQQWTICDILKREDYPEDEFIENSKIISNNIINAVSKLTATEEVMERQVGELETKMRRQNRQKTVFNATIDNSTTAESIKKQ